MLAQTPVLASNTGGPLETVVDGVTGWLRDVGDVDAWRDVMLLVLRGLSETDLKDMGSRGRERVREHFSRETMGVRLDEEIAALCGKKGRVKTLELGDVLFWMVLVGGVCVAGVVLLSLRR